MSNIVEKPARIKKEASVSRKRAREPEAVHGAHTSELAVVKCEDVVSVGGVANVAANEAAVSAPSGIDMLRRAQRARVEREAREAEAAKAALAKEAALLAAQQLAADKRFLDNIYHSVPFAARRAYHEWLVNLALENVPLGELKTGVRWGVLDVRANDIERICKKVGLRVDAYATLRYGDWVQIGHEFNDRSHDWAFAKFTQLVLSEFAPSPGISMSCITVTKYEATTFKYEAVTSIVCKVA